MGKEGQASRNDGVRRCDAIDPVAAIERLVAPC